jgi:hypothetical protein
MLLAFRRYMLPPASGLKGVKWASFCVCIGSCFEDNAKRGGLVLRLEQQG